MYFKNKPSYLSILLNEKQENLEQIIYFTAGIKTKKTVRSIREDWTYPQWYYAKNATKEERERYDPILDLKLLYGGEAIEEALYKLKLHKTSLKIITEIKILNAKIQNLEKKLEYAELSIEEEEKELRIRFWERKIYIRRLRLINNFIKNKTKPKWLVIKYLPVLPPDLRPIMITEGGL